MFIGHFYGNFRISLTFLAVFLNFPVRNGAFILLGSDSHPDVFYLPFYRVFTPRMPAVNPRMVCAAADVAPQPDGL